MKQHEMVHRKATGGLGTDGVPLPPTDRSSTYAATAHSTASTSRLWLPDISVIVVSWNTRDELRACLDSVFAGLRGILGEVIVVDNASIDGSPEMVETSFPEVHLVRNSRNLGFAAGCNIGLQVAFGRNVLLLNPDTIVLGDVLAATVRYLDDHPNVGAFGCRVRNPDGTLQPTCFRDPSVVNTFLGLTGLARLPWPRALGRERMTHWLRDNERDVDVVTGCYLASHREVVDDVGLLDSGYFFCGEEADWCRRIRSRGWAVRFSPVGEIIHADGAAGRKLSERRDLLGMAGLVRYAHHHDGWLAGWAMWALVWLHAATRALAFEVIGIARRNGEGRHAANLRRDHYRRVVKGHSEIRALAGLRPRHAHGRTAPAVSLSAQGPNTASSEYVRSPTDGASTPLK
jgi:GT2 family glycosyltransferase